MIPQGAIVQDIQLDTAPLPSRTYRLDFIKKRVLGRTDGVEALKQAVYKILQTERYEHFIYSHNYGSELQGLNGDVPLLLRSELERRIREALMQDDRISAVRDFVMEWSGESVLVSFTVVSQFGSFNQEVIKDV